MTLPPNLPPYSNQSMPPNFPNMPPPLNDEPALLAEPNQVNAGVSLDWIKTGWVLISGNVFTFLGALVVFFLIAVVLQLIPKIGGIIYWIVSIILVPGFAYMFHQKAEGYPVTVGQLFQGFRQNTGQILMIVVWTFLATVVILLILGAVLSMMGGMANLQMSMAVAAATRSPFAFFTGRIMILLLVALLLYIPLLMAQWLASTIVILHGIKAIDAMKLSFQACMRNGIPLLVFGLIIFLIGLLAMIPIGISIWLLMTKSIALFMILLILMLIGQILLMMVFMATNYVAYRDLVTDQPLT